MKTEELRKRFRDEMHKAHFPEAEDLYRTLKVDAVEDWVISEIEAAERRRTEEIVALIKRHSKAVKNDSKATPENARHSLDTQAWVLDQTAKSIRSKFLKNPEQ